LCELRTQGRLQGAGGDDCLEMKPVISCLARSAYDTRAVRKKN